MRIAGRRPRLRTTGVRRSRWTVAVALASLCLGTIAFAAEHSEDPIRACDFAATHAEAEWHLPAGVLSAIGAVESGRRGLASTLPVAWPWTINAGGQGLYLPSTAAAAAAVRAFRAGGVQMIDVGCFQVDLFYHPESFASLEAAFDPDVNAQAAARILAQSRLSSGSWEAAVALYHSASPMRGARYLRQVQAAWPGTRARGAASLDAALAPLLSPAASQVRILHSTDTLALPGLPRVLAASAATVVQWTVAPRTDLPVILAPTKEPRLPPEEAGAKQRRDLRQSR